MSQINKNEYRDITTLFSVTQKGWDFRDDFPCSCNFVYSLIKLNLRQNIYNFSDRSDILAVIHNL